MSLLALTYVRAGGNKYVDHRVWRLGRLLRLEFSSYGRLGHEFVLESRLMRWDGGWRLCFQRRRFGIALTVGDRA